MIENKGFSLISLAMLTAMAGLISVALSNMVLHSSKIESSMDSMRAISYLDDEIRFFLRNKERCSSAMPSDSFPRGSSERFPGIEFRNPGSDPTGAATFLDAIQGEIVAAVDLVYFGVKIEKMDLVLDGDGRTAQGLYPAVLQVTIAKEIQESPSDGRRTLGIVRKNLEFALMLRTQPSGAGEERISECLEFGENASELDLMARLCESMGGDFDLATEDCDVPRSEIEIKYLNCPNTGNPRQVRCNCGSDDSDFNSQLGQNQYQNWTPVSVECKPQNPGPKVFVLHSGMPPNTLGPWDRYCEVGGPGGPIAQMALTCVRVNQVPAGESNEDEETQSL